MFVKSQCLFKKNDWDVDRNEYSKAIHTIYKYIWDQFRPWDIAAKKCLTINERKTKSKNLPKGAMVNMSFLVTYLSQRVDQRSINLYLAKKKSINLYQ